MGTKRKLLVSIITAILVVIGASTSMVVVFALTQQNLSSRIIVSFETVDVDGKVSAKYHVGSNSADLTTSTGETEIIFDAKDETADKGKLSLPEGGVGLTTSNDFVVIEYTFTNTGDVEYSAIMNYSENDLIVENMIMTYSLDGLTYSTSEYGIIINARSSKKYYVKVALDNKSKDAYLKGVVNWLLEKYDGEQDIEKVNLSATTFTKLDDGNYSASYNGEDISISGSQAISAQSNTIENLWYVPSRLGSATVTTLTKAGKDENGNQIYLPANTKVVIAEGVQIIEDGAFYNCSGLIEITIPKSLVKSQGSNLFNNCSNLKRTNYLGDIYSWMQIYFSTPPSNPIFASKNLYINNQLVTTANIDTATKINNFCFYNLASLKNVIIGKNITSIPTSVFETCTGLESLEVDSENPKYHSAGNCIIETASKTLILGCKNSIIPTDGSVTRIGSSVFSYCTSLTSIIIPESVTSIGNYAFQNCTGLTSIEIPNSVTSIGDSAFSHCTSLTSIIIPESVTSIGNSAFSWCTSLTSIIIPESVTSIGSSAFYYCTSLTSIIIPDTVTSIGDYAFCACTSLTSIIIPESVTIIGYRTFYNCTSLTSVEFKNPNGWSCATSSTATSGTSISATDLANQTTAATYLTSTYCEQYWKRG